MTEHLLSTVAGRTWTTDMLCVLGVLCVFVFVGCALGLPFLRLVLVPVVRTWRRMTPFARIAIVPAIALVANFAASKQGGTNAPPNGASPPSGGNVELTMENVELRSLPVAEQVVTNLCFTSISISTNSVVLSLAWPTNFFAEGDCLDFFAKADSLTNRWAWIGSHTVAAGETNLVVEVALQQLAPSATNMPSAAFFLVSDRATSAATMSDWDSDGIPDVYELHHGTNPYFPDAWQVPRLTVGVGGEYPTVAAALAASTDYSVLALAAGEYDFGSSSIVMPAHPVMLVGPEGGYAVLRSSAAIGAVMLVDGQGEDTLFRNLHVVLEARQNFQAGFWIGGNLPWSGIGASPTFENVRVRAPHPGVLYYGWHYYRDDGGTSVLSNCTMNAAGATDVIGVYSYGGPDVSVVDCRFVNFPVTNENYATYCQDGTNIVAEYAAPEPGLSWAGYPLDGEYSAAVDSDGDGLSDYDEMFVYDTDPWLADSDGDGVADGVEVLDGTDPRVLGSFLRHVTVVVTADDMLAGVTNYVAWGVAANGWETNDMVAAAFCPVTNEFTIAVSNAAAYVKAYRDMNRNGVYDHDDDILLSQSIPESSTTTIRFAFGDVDRDGVSDLQEISEGTNPYDAKNYCFNLALVEQGVIRTTNDLSVVVMFGDAAVYGPVFATNRTFMADVGHLVATNGESVVVYFWDDANSNGVRDVGEAFTSYNIPIRGHESTVTNAFPTAAFDRDGDGIMDWWEDLHADAGLSSTNSADARFDPDGDGLINLHEYWADCNPLVYDGTNTVLSVMARSVDERLANTTCSCIYVSYNQSAVLNGLQKNENNWAYDIDLSCASPWNGWHSMCEAGVLLTRRHVLFAKHYLFQYGEGNRRLYFRPRNGGVYSGVVIATNVSMHTDIAVVLLGEDVPDSVSSAAILPSNYADYIGNGNGLPMLTLDYQEKALVHDVSSFPSGQGNFSALYPVAATRLANSEPIVIGDSGNPRFLLMGTTPILVGTVWTGPNSPGAGPFITTWKNEIQTLIDKLSRDAELSTNDYQLVEYDLSQFRMLIR